MTDSGQMNHVVSEIPNQQVTQEGIGTDQPTKVKDESTNVDLQIGIGHDKVVK